MPQHRELVRGLLVFLVTLAELSDTKERQSPSAGSTVELGFLGSVLHVQLPQSPDSQQLTETGTFDERFNPAMHVSTRVSRFPGPSADPLWVCSFSHPLHRSTRHQYSFSKRRWQIYGRCGNVWC